ncbi:hypothetical protein [Mycolicibacterium sp. XJ1819]
MALSWWPVAVVGLCCLAGAFALALLPPADQVRRQLRPLANTSRLTRLPEYIRLARARTLSTVVTIVLLVVLFGAAVTAGARPTGWVWSTTTAEAAEDVMLCVGEPVTSEVTGEFLSYFAQQAGSYGTERIGLTSPNRRVVPLTRDHQYAVATFADLAQASQPDADPDVVRGRVAAFAAPVSYVDYAPSVADILALCVTGFPSFDTPGEHRRSLIYLGPEDIRRPGDTRPSLFTDEQLSELVSRSGVQVNALATAPGGELRSLAKSTGGQFFTVDTPDIDADLDAIRAHPPTEAPPAQSTARGWLGDSPAVPLTVAVVASLLLCLSLVVVRR